MFRSVRWMLLAAVLVPLQVKAQLAGQIVDDHRDASGHGALVLKLEGDYHAMGHAQGVLLGEHIAAFIAELRAYVGEAYYQQLRQLAASTRWLEPRMDEELEGLLAGIQESTASTEVDLVDLKALNGMGDWGYLCRSHAAWGSRVQEPVQFLATRRLDYGTPFDRQYEHVIAVYRPTGGEPWVNVTWPGFIAVVTAVGRSGQVVSLHDYQSGDGTPPAQAVSRAGLARQALFGWGEAADSDPLGHIYGLLQDVPVLTGTFVNIHGPHGHAGVITCSRSQGCHDLRVPQADYFDGEVIMTTNAQTDGHTTPTGGDFMASYYQTLGAKDLESHFELMGDSGLHLVTVAYRSDGDMTIGSHSEPRRSVHAAAGSSTFSGDHRATKSSRLNVVMPSAAIDSAAATCKAS